MIPIRDNIPSKNYPVVNNTIIGINIIVFLIQISQGADFDRFVYFYGLVPARYFVPQVADYFSFAQQAFSLFSFMFLHGGFLHLLGNMWSLYIFGNNIEDRLGPLRYICFYLLCGLLSGLSHLLLNYQSNVPTIGASGAIAGVMGAYFVLYPQSRILTLIPILFIPWFVEIPAFFFLGVWFVLQILNAAGTAGGIAWWAHIGGFVFGIILLQFFKIMPETGITSKMRDMTAKKKSPGLQVLHTSGPMDDPDLYASISISTYEALAGARKLVNIPWGFQRQIYRITIPPGIKDGQTLRLRGMGKRKPNGDRGDLQLKINVKQITP
jgi:hypothetical protein